MANRLFGVGSVVYKVRAYDPADMSFKVESASYGTNLYAVCSDGTYVYAGGHSTVGKVFKYRPGTLEKLAESVALGQIRRLFYYNGYIYVGSSDDHVYRLDPTDLSTEATSADLGGDVRGLCTDNTYIYATSGDRVAKLNASTLVTVGSLSSAYDAFESAACDGTNVYAVGFGAYKVYKFRCSDLAKIDESLAFGAGMLAVHYWDGAVYAGGGDDVTGRRIRKYNTSLDLLDTLDTDQYITDFGNDGTYLYASGGLGGDYGTIKKIDVSDLSLVDETDDYGGVISAMCYADVPIAPALYPKIGGSYKNLESSYAKVGGSWKTVIQGWTKIGGVWKPC